MNRTPRLAPVVCLVLGLGLAQPLTALAQPVLEDEPMGSESDPVLEEEGAPPVALPAPPRMPPPRTYVRVGRPAPMPEPPPPAPQPSSFRVGLEATAGYGGISFLFDETYHGPMVEAALTLGWMVNPVNRMLIGMRLHGFYGRALNEKPSYCSPSTYGYASTCTSPGHDAGGVNIGFYFETHGFWFSPGIGLIHLVERRSSHNDRTTLPEGVLAFGFNIPLGRTLSIRIGAEGGTSILVWRAQATAGFRILL